jgi:hypothetical protein
VTHGLRRGSNWSISAEIRLRGPVSEMVILRIRIRFIFAPPTGTHGSSAGPSPSYVASRARTRLPPCSRGQQRLAVSGGWSTRSRPPLIPPPAPARQLLQEGGIIEQNDRPAVHATSTIRNRAATDPRGSAHHNGRRASEIAREPGRESVATDQVQPIPC